MAAVISSKAGGYDTGNGEDNKPPDAEKILNYGGAVWPDPETSERFNYDSMDAFSGVHDLTKVQTICDTAMVFAVFEDENSHIENEYISWDDCRRA